MIAENGSTWSVASGSACRAYLRSNKKNSSHSTRPRGNLWLNHQSVCFLLESLPPPIAVSFNFDGIRAMERSDWSLKPVVDEEVQTEGDAVEVIDVSAHEPRRIPSKKRRELIKEVWEADPLRCPKCLLRLQHRSGHGVLRHLKRLAAPECASGTLVQRPPALRRRSFGLRARPATRKSPCLTSGPTFFHSAPMETYAFGFRLLANAPEGQKRFPISQLSL